MSLLDTVSTVSFNKQKARELLQEYRAAKVPRTDEDVSIMTAYRAIASGRVVIQAAQSIRDAGWNDEGLPKLAMTRADVRRCRASVSNTSVEFSDDRATGHKAIFRVDQMPERPRVSQWRATATVPLIPLPHRPKGALRNYWILWEASWVRAPVDPLLLRKLSGDLWLVLAAWELSAVERAVLERRVNS